MVEQCPTFIVGDQCLAQGAVARTPSILAWLCLGKEEGGETSGN